MSIPEGYSKACCNVPPVEANYKPKGEYTQISGMKTYKTGSTSSPLAILVIGDIFGTGPQVEQGADILAYGGDSSHQYQVYVPDFLHGHYAEHSWLPPDTPEKQKLFGDYFAGPANFGTRSKEVAPALQEIESKSNGTIKKWAVLGLCWGGKVATLLSGSGTKFSAVVSAHPAMTDPEEAKAISIPFAQLASKDEDASAIKSFDANLKGPKFTTTFDKMPHGWMAARGDLSDPEVKADFEKGYKATLGFFHEHL